MVDMDGVKRRQRRSTVPKKYDFSDAPDHDNGDDDGDFADEPRLQPKKKTPANKRETPEKSKQKATSTAAAPPRGKKRKQDSGDETSAGLRATRAGKRFKATSLQTAVTPVAASLPSIHDPAASITAEENMDGLNSMPSGASSPLSSAPSSPIEPDPDFMNKLSFKSRGVIGGGGLLLSETTRPTEQALRVTAAEQDQETMPQSDGLSTAPLTAQTRLTSESEGKAEQPKEGLEDETPTLGTNRGDVAQTASPPISTAHQAAEDQVMITSGEENSIVTTDAVDRASEDNPITSPDLFAPGPQASISAEDIIETETTQLLTPPQSVRKPSESSEDDALVQASEHERSSTAHLERAATPTTRGPHEDVVTSHDTAQDVESTDNGYNPEMSDGAPVVKRRKLNPKTMQALDTTKKSPTARSKAKSVAAQQDATPKKSRKTPNQKASVTEPATPPSKSKAMSEKKTAPANSKGKMSKEKPTLTKPTKPKARIVTKRKWYAKDQGDSKKHLKHSLIVALEVPAIAIPKLTPKQCRLLELSKKLMKREPLHLKPLPLDEPEVWAESRQALCETLPYFKKPQGGCYSNDNHVYGFLFDSVGHSREYMDENLIISRAGGSMEQDSDKTMAQKKDQLMTESQVVSVLNDKQHRNPVAVICGNRNSKAPCKMPHLYNVLDWYKPVFAWSEKTAGKGCKLWTTVKYRLERLNRLKTAWHAPQSQIRPSPEERRLAGPIVWTKCESCENEYPQVYLRRWMCLNDQCVKFWKLDGMDAPYDAKYLEYHPAFLLNEVERWEDNDDLEEPEPAPLKPPLPIISDAIGDNLTHRYTRGICCPKCGRCNSRRFFRGWICENPGCKYKLIPKHRPVKPAMLHTPWDLATLTRNSFQPGQGVKVRVLHKFNYKVSIYTFDGLEGCCFIHAAATKGVVEAPKGPDEMFAALQTEDMGLERRTFKVKKAGSNEETQTDVGKHNLAEIAVAPSKDNDEDHQNASQPPDQEPTAEDDMDETLEFAPGDLMIAFSMNYGMPYKFVASGASRPFDTAPWPVSQTRRLLNWAAPEFINQLGDHTDFNEQLIFAYLESQKIEYHDDGEEGLGPVIGTLSLGGRAKMMLRMKAKYHVGCSKTGILTKEKPIPGGMKYEERLEAWEELQKIKNDSAAYSKRAKEIPKELGLFESRSKTAADLLTVTLSHGDMVFMSGYDIQKYFEHKVAPEGHLRFALTCRTVLANHLKPEEQPGYSVEVDPIKYEPPKLRSVATVEEGPWVNELPAEHGAE